MTNRAPLAAKHGAAFARRQVEFWRSDEPSLLGITEPTRLGLLARWETQLAKSESALLDATR